LAADPPDLLDLVRYEHMGSGPYFQECAQVRRDLVNVLAADRRRREQDDTDRVGRFLSDEGQLDVAAKLAHVCPRALQYGLAVEPGQPTGIINPQPQPASCHSCHV
jgi:hypothetical protein